MVRQALLHTVRGVRVLLLLAPPLLAVVAVVIVACNSGTTLVIEVCSDAGLPACFSNDDCATSAHCTTPDAADPNVVVTCCVAGARGATAAGAACLINDACASAVCAYTPSGSFCSQACQPGQPGQPSAGCPSTLPSCITLDAGVNDGGIISFCGIEP